jgi:predicted Zn-dependent protease
VSLGKSLLIEHTMYFKPLFAASLTRRAVTRIGVAAILSLVLITATKAAPYLPANDSTPLERLANNASGRERQVDTALRSNLARDPQNITQAVRAAQRYISRARSESDPRFLGQAQAVLSHWWSLEEPPTTVLLLRATIRQSNHDFVNARRDLERLVKREPTNAQGWLTLATVQQVSGDLDAAVQSCQSLKPLTTPLVSTTCAAAIDGARGRATKAYDSLNNAIVDAQLRTPLTVGVSVWATTLQAELAERLGRSGDAQRLYDTSLRLDPSDTYTRAMYADYLIDRKRYSDVLILIPGTTPVDILLLRRAIAAKLVAAPDATKVAEVLAQRFAASSARGDRLHLREESRFALVIKNSPSEALALAIENWRIQKEPLDARILLEAAFAAKQPQQTKDVLAWLNVNPLQGEKISELVRWARGAT